MTQKANNSEHGDSRKREVQMPLFGFASGWKREEYIHILHTDATKEFYLKKKSYS
jgi:hypothetical protein